MCVFSYPTYIFPVEPGQFFFLFFFSCFLKKKKKKLEMCPQYTDAPAVGYLSTNALT